MNLADCWAIIIAAGFVFVLGVVAGAHIENAWFRRNLPSEFTTRLPANVMRRLGRWS
jgi:hypothetical protein